MAAIQERKTASGETRFRALVRIKGRPAVTATFQRKTDARRWAQQTEADVRRGKYFAESEARSHTFAELVDHYLENGLQGLSESEKTGRRRHLGWWRKQLGAYALSGLGPRVIAEARNRLATNPTSGRPISVGTQNRYLCSLSTVFRYAIRELEWLDSNPAGKVDKRKEPRGRVRFLDEGERRRLLDACKDSRNPHLYLLTLLAISTGMRQGEILGLRWCDLDLDRGVALVLDSKNGDRRAVPLVGPGLEILSERAATVEDPRSRVFIGSRGRVSFPYNAWNVALERAGIEDFRFHDCRHTAASYLAQSGARLHEIADILGHRTLAMVKRYAHLTEPHTLGVARRMADQFLVD